MASKKCHFSQQDSKSFELHYNSEFISIAQRHTLTHTHTKYIVNISFNTVPSDA